MVFLQAQQVRSESWMGWGKLVRVGGGKLGVMSGGGSEVTVTSDSPFIIRDQDGFPVAKIDSDGWIHTKKGVRKTANI